MFGRHAQPLRQQLGAARRIALQGQQAPLPACEEGIHLLRTRRQRIGPHHQHVHDVARGLAAVENGAKTGFAQSTRKRLVGDHGVDSLAAQRRQVLTGLHVVHHHIGLFQTRCLQQAPQHHRAHRGALDRNGFAPELVQPAHRFAGHHQIATGRCVKHRHDLHVHAFVGQAQGLVQRQGGSINQAVAHIAQSLRARRQFNHLDLLRVHQPFLSGQHQRVVTHPGVHPHFQGRQGHRLAGRQRQAQRHRGPTARPAGNARASLHGGPPLPCGPWASVFERSSGLVCHVEPKNSWIPLILTPSRAAQAASKPGVAWPWRSRGQPLSQTANRPPPPGPAPAPNPPLRARWRSCQR